MEDKYFARLARRHNELPKGKRDFEIAELISQGLKLYEETNNRVCHT